MTEIIVSKDYSYMTEKEWVSLYKTSILLESLKIGPTITLDRY